jgi:nitrate reductase NapE component
MTLDEDWLGSKLQRFHQKTSNRYLFLNNHIDSLRLWDSPNFVFTQESDPSIRVKNPDSYLSHYHLPTKFALTFFKKFFKKKAFISYFKSILKNFDKATYKSYSYIRYPSFKKKPTNSSSPNITNLSHDKLGEDFQIKSKFGTTLVLHSIPKLKKKLPLKLLLLSITNSDMRSLLYINFSYKDPLSFTGKAHLFFMKSLIKNSPNFNLEDLLIPISLLSTNNLMSSPVQFFNESRGALQPFKTNPLLKSPRYNKGTQPPIKSQFRPSYRGLGSFYTRYLPYLLFRVNIRQNPIRRPLYSTFLTSSKILKTHSFRISLNKSTPSLTKYPVSTLNSQAHLLSSSNLLKFSFLYTNSDNLFEVNINNSLNSYATNYLSFKRSLTTPALFSQNLTFGDKLQPSTYGSLGSLKTCEKKRSELSLWLFIDSTVNPVYNLFNLPFLYKFFFWNYQLLYGRPNMSIDFNWSFFLKKFSNNLIVPNRISRLTTTNIIPLGFFKSSVKKRVVKTLSNDIYIPRTTIYFYRTLINFIEYHTGKRVFLKLNPFLEGSLTFKDSCRCSIWYNKINIFQKILGHRIFVHESLRIFMAAVRFRDPTFLANWIRSMLYRMSFWKYRVLFRYIKYVFRALFLPYFDELDFKGVRLVVRGKISVAGNARARTLAFSVGNTSNSEFNNRVLSSFNTIDSFTGVMGFRLTFYF